MGQINDTLYSIIKAPLITEKVAALNPLRKYMFLVDKRANKIDIRRAVEKVYNVKVNDVNCMIVKGKTKRVRWQAGKTASWKKAIVTLKEGSEIKFT